MEGNCSRILKYLLILFITNLICRRQMANSSTLGQNIIRSPNLTSGMREGPLQILQNTLWLQKLTLQHQETHDDDDLCTFERICNWEWDDEFHIVSGENFTSGNATIKNMPGPSADSDNNTRGHFLHIIIQNTTQQKIIRSPEFGPTLRFCKMEMDIHQSNMKLSQLRVIIEPANSPNYTSVLKEINGNNFKKWIATQFPIGALTQHFRVLFEIIPRTSKRGHISIDNLVMKDCLTAPERGNELCKFRCDYLRSYNVCITNKEICDIDINCNFMEDELKYCEKIPYGGRCDFETDTCGWHNAGKAIMSWQRHSGPTPTDKTGPDADHTYPTAKGHYMLVNMNQYANDSEKKALVSFASNAIMNSAIFNPPPPVVHVNSSSTYANACTVRFYMHHYGPNLGSLNLSVVEIKEKENITTTLWWSDRKPENNNWVRVDLFMPYITSRYYLQFEARMGVRIYSDAAIDDFSLSPECFGINIPEMLLQGYNYYDPRLLSHKQPHRDFRNQSVIEITTCGARGKEGPTNEQFQKVCNKTLNSSTTRLIDKDPLKGVQVWKVPKEDYYTIIAKGAGGGLGSSGVGTSRGSLVRTVIELHKDEEIYVVVGQKGESACIKSMDQRDVTCETGIETGILEKSKYSKTHLIKNMIIDNVSGGGGGGTFLFIKTADKVAVPLLVAAGGGGLGVGRHFDRNDFQHGKGFDDINQLDSNGDMIGEINKTGGSGGGWKCKNNDTLLFQMGRSILNSSAGIGGGGIGGDPCYTTTGLHGQGGFGGGGGGCSTGGGGGGYAGGDTSLEYNSGNGGTSFIRNSRTKLSIVYAGENADAGVVVIIPALSGPACGCSYRCIALDEFRATFACICSPGSRLKKNSRFECELVISDDDTSTRNLILFFIVVCFLLALALGGLVFMLYNRYQQNKRETFRKKTIFEQDLQLSRLRHGQVETAVLSFNPQYGFEGTVNGRISDKQLPQVARDSLRLIRALGQGAFGEVFEGTYRHRDGDSIEMPVAIKTLPELSTGQAEVDFLMEAAIMAQFKHTNIIHLIGVCFDRHPRFIVLELLGGGDLKNFLREARVRLEIAQLTMKDLIHCAIDVAKGCRYLESKRFIHRDIATRNCLLTCKGPGRVVKIADFGMSRDIYRSDYYRKGGKALLPIKWMPPEAFLDGIFTSKTDVWSFGIVLWEIFSLGLMPYTGLPNRNVMQLVTLGGRLEPPLDCPSVACKLMEMCWNPEPDGRPSFTTILDKLNASVTDADIVNAPLPNANKMIAAQDHTRMRAPEINKELVQKLSRIPQCDSDYLIPDGQEMFNIEDIGKELEALRNQMANNITSVIEMPNAKPEDLNLPKLINFDTPQQTPGALPETEPFNYADSGDATTAETDTNNVIENTIETCKNVNDKIITNAIDLKLNGNIKDMETDTLSSISSSSSSSSATTETAPVISSPDEVTSKQITDMNTTTTITTNSETAPIISKDIAKLSNELTLNAMALNNGTIYATVQPTLASSLSQKPKECERSIENLQNKSENSFCPPFTINGHGDAINNNDKFSKR